jgi:hypothetical protein
MCSEWYLGNTPRQWCFENQEQEPDDQDAKNFDSEKQTGLVGAADRINDLRTELSSVSPFTMLVKVGDTTSVQVAQN